MEDNTDSEHVLKREFLLHFSIGVEEATQVFQFRLSFAHAPTKIGDISLFDAAGQRLPATPRHRITKDIGQWIGIIEGSDVSLGSIKVLPNPR